MAEIKTVPKTTSIEHYLKTIDTRKLADTHKLIELMQDITGEKPVIWGNNLIGFGKIHLKYHSGREIDYFMLGFAVRKNTFTIYLSIEVNKKVFDSLGKHKKGVGCLYIHQLSDIHLEELKHILIESFDSMKERL